MTRPVFAEVSDERDRQDAKWGGPDHDDNHTLGNWTAWLSFIDEHNRKAFSPDNSEEAYDNFRRRMIEVAALAVAAVESLDRVLASPEART